MAETAQTMTEFTYAPGEKNIVGDRFSPSVIIFWLKTSIAASSTRVQYKAPNTLFGLIPLGASTKTIPLRNIASVDTNTKFNLGSLVWGLFFLFVGFGMFDSNALAAIVCLLIAVANFANVMSATLTFHDPSGGANAITVSILDARQPAGAGPVAVRASPAGRVTSSKNRKEDRAEKSKSALFFRLIR